MQSKLTHQSATSRHLALVAGLTTLLTVTALADSVPTRKETLQASVTAAVEAINLETREVTLKGASGKPVTFLAGPEIERLNEVKVGDLVTAKYRVSIAAELREATAAERENPLTILGVEGRADKSTAPAAGAARKIRVVTTIEEIDRVAATVTIKGPLGRLVTAHVEKPAVLDKMQVGKTIVITYTEALAVSLEKAPQ